jgi:GNAT superfamily N-acetyltransferase
MPLVTVSEDCRPLLRTGFLNDFDAATVPCSFSTKRGYMQTFPDVPVSIGLTYEDGDTYVALEMFEAHPGVRATGAGTEAMRRLLNLTDKHGLSVYLDPHPLDEGWSWDRLVRWYASFGFDFEEDAEYRAQSGNYWMQRLPHAGGPRVLIHVARPPE